MEPKKSEKADLERKKRLFFQIGLVIALLLVFLVFEYARHKEESILGKITGFIPEDVPEIVIDAHKDTPPPPVATSLPPVVVENNIPTDDPDFGHDFKSDDTIPNVIVEIPDHKERTDTFAIIDFADVNPEYPGGDAARIKFLVDNIKYPRHAIELRIEGRVMLGFVVEPDGNISNVQVLRSPDASLEEEAVRVTKLMPKWKPGLQNGRTVRVRYAMPIEFKLTN
ncbi:MAG: TonB family protein [Lentimicrobiaceae bacterium]|nr:TonB family protein [Lentimicrobiaceae bacterium]